MRRSITKAISLVASVALVGAFGSIAVLADESEDRYNAQRETNDLLDREKLLQKQADELNRSIYETKQKIKYLAEDLDAQLAEQNRIRHELIVTRIKLLH